MTPQLTPQQLALYLGCECQYTDEDGNILILPLLAVNLSGYAWFVDPEFEEAIEIKDVKPILRRLSSMTEEEADTIWHMDEPEAILKMETGTKSKKVVMAPQRMQYLLSKHFDLFGWIDAGLAIEKKA